MHRSEFTSVHLPVPVLLSFHQLYASGCSFISVFTYASVYSWGYKKMCFVKLSLNKHKTKLIIQKYWFLSKLDWNWLSAVDIVSMRLLEVTFRLIILSLSSHTTSGKKCSEGIPLGEWMERAGDVTTVFPNHSGIDENSVSAFSLVTDKDCGSLKDKKTTVSYSVKVYFT